MKRLAFLIPLWLMTICVVCAQTAQVDLNTVKEPVVQYQEKVNEVDAKGRELEASFKELSAHVSCLEYAVDMQKDLIAQEQSVIENGFAASNLVLVIFSILIAFAGIFLGVYINRKEKSIKSILNEAKNQQDSIIILKKNIEETAISMKSLDNEMKNNVDGLYARLQRNETIGMLERLVEVPEDISNLIGFLLARNLESDDFTRLFNAYAKLSKMDTGDILIDIECKATKEKYLLLFFQHFFEKSIQTPVLKEVMIEYLPDALNCAFRLDIDKTLSSLIDTLNCTSIDNGNENALTSYILALYESKHRQYTEPYQFIVNHCNDTINLKTVWNTLVKQKVIIEPFGNLLCEKYKDDAEFVNKVKEQMASLHLDTKDEELGNSQES